MKFFKSIKSICWQKVFSRIWFCTLVSGLLFSSFTPQALAIDYNKQVLMDRDFSHQNLNDASFDHSNLRGSNLSFATAQGVRFFGANLADANLEGADLRFAEKTVLPELSTVFWSEFS